jgi:hypothetical protein
MSGVNLINPVPYVPVSLFKPAKLLDVVTGWQPCDEAIGDILNRFSIQRQKMLEFGVEYGFSTSAFANYFSTVVAVDHFRGDQHAGFKDVWNETSEKLKAFPNVVLLRADYRDWINTVKSAHFDLIHIDIVHTFLDTYQCGRWAADHADIVLFHDTILHAAVNSAVMAVAAETGMTYYNLDVINGLGILTKKELQ